MESFLKYLRGGAVVGTQRSAPVVATTIAASACEDAGGGGEAVDDDASFFDLEFAVPGDESAASDAEEERVEFNFAVAGESGAEVVDAVPATGAEEGKKDGAEEEVAEPAPSTSVVRPATKFRVLLLKLRKPKAPVQATDGNGPAAAAKTNRFLIKFRVDDTPLVSLENSSSSRTSGADRPPAVQVQTSAAAAQAGDAEERRFAKEVLLKYLNKIKPLYVKVSRLRFPGASEGEETDAEPEPSQPQLTPPPQPVVVACGVRAPRAGVPAGLKQVCKRLGKSRSASSAVAAAPSPSLPAAPPSVTTVPQRRDDSLLQVQDGIQSAIAHCKRSFNASKGCESPLLRSMAVGGEVATRDGNSDAA